MKKHLLTAFLICISFLSLAQGPISPQQSPTRQVGWGINENFDTFQKTADGGVIAVNSQTKKYSETGTLQFTLPFAPKHYFQLRTVDILWA